MPRRLKIGVVAPSSQVPAIELKLGLDALKAEGFRLKVHPQVRKSHLFFAGTDEERARAFFDYAVDPQIDAIWCARGGYGALRVLPLLEKMTAERGIPERKLLIGYSDATILLEYVRARWGWAVLHAPMPSMRSFTILSSGEWSSLIRCVKGNPEPPDWSGEKLRFHGRPPKRPVEGQMVGGNLASWNSLTGTPYEPRAKGKILFFEDIDESLYRVDRMVRHLATAAAFDGVLAIVLGDFLNCGDHSTRVIRKLPPSRSLNRVLTKPRDSELKPLRKTLDEREGLLQIFGETASKLGVPLAFGLPAGHGPGRSPVPLGAEYILYPDGRLTLLNWSWTRQNGAR